MHPNSNQADQPYSVVSPSGGKWLIFVPLAKLDETWSLIKKETEAGRLGPASKASTLRDNSNAADQNMKVICVYTHDAEDREDVMRVRKRLFELKFTKKLAYKTNETTLAGRYSSSGRTSKYYE